jgi:hypothetical protein
LAPNSSRATSDVGAARRREGGLATRDAELARGGDVGVHREAGGDVGLAVDIGDERRPNARGTIRASTCGSPPPATVRR